MSDMREKFEAWALTQGWNTVDIGRRRHKEPDHYFEPVLHDDWKVWQAAWNARADAGTVENLKQALRDILHWTKEYSPSSMVAISAICELTLGESPNLHIKAAAKSLKRVTEKKVSVAPQPHALADEAIWLIWSNEHTGWWNPECIGYTSDINQAGHYTYQQAVDICGSEYPHGSDGVPDEIMVLSPKGRAALRQSRERDLRLIEFTRQSLGMSGDACTKADILQAFEERDR